MCYQKNFFAVITAINIAVVPIFFFLTGIDVLIINQATYTWMDIVSAIFGGLGISCFINGLWRAISVLCKPDTFSEPQWFWSAMWLILSVLSLGISTLFHEKWFLAGIMLSYSACSALILIVVGRMLNGNEHDDPDEESHNSNGGENEPLLTANN